MFCFGGTHLQSHNAQQFPGVLGPDDRFFRVVVEPSQQLEPLLVKQAALRTLSMGRLGRIRRWRTVRLRTKLPRSKLHT